MYGATGFLFMLPVAALLLKEALPESETHWIAKLADG